MNSPTSGAPAPLPNAAEQATGCDQTTPEALAPPVILIVDDDLPMRILLDRYVTLFGYRALLAPDGENALLIARQNPQIRLVMLDVVMSGLCGQKLAEELTVLLPEVPILFCSGHPAPALARLGIEIQSAQFMQKPCRPLELKQRLGEMLAGR